MTDYRYLSDVSSSHHYFNRKKGQFSAEVISDPVNIIYRGRQNTHYGKRNEEEFLYRCTRLYGQSGKYSMFLQRICHSLYRRYGFRCLLNILMSSCQNAFISSALLPDSIIFLRLSEPLNKSIQYMPLENFPQKKVEKSSGLLSARMDFASVYASTRQDRLHFSFQIVSVDFVRKSWPQQV